MYISEEICEAIRKVEEGMGKEYKSMLLKLQYRELYKLHFGLGTWIRNTFLEKESDLYKYFLSIGVDSADSMSSVILTYLYFYLKSKKAGH